LVVLVDLRCGSLAGSFQIVDGTILTRVGSVEFSAGGSASPESGPPEAAFSFGALQPSVGDASRGRCEHLPSGSGLSLNDRQPTFGDREIGRESSSPCLAGGRVPLCVIELAA
jgi:hypothetical protein